MTMIFMNSICMTMIFTNGPMLRSTVVVPVLPSVHLQEDVLKDGNV